VPELKFAYFTIDLPHRARTHDRTTMPFASLTSTSVLGYLRERDLLDDVPAERISVTEMIRRNLNLAVSVDGRPAWFVKQIQYGTPEVIASQRREARCYQIAQETPSLSRLRALMPHCVLFDAERFILVLECLDGVNAAEAHVQVGAFNGQVAGILGGRLALLHATSPLALRSALRTLLPAELPWVLQPSTHRVPLSQRAAYLAQFETEVALAREIAELRDNWCGDTLIHGDARLENFYLCRPANDEAELDTRVVDWELADIGDAAWDCAGVMQHYWQEWIRETPASPERWEALRGAIERFWAAYAAGRGEDPQPGGPAFRRATRLTGVRLIQTSYEHFARSGSWTPMVERCARTAQLLLTDTDTALHGFGTAHRGV
jgi:hypothetical protein